MTHTWLGYSMQYFQVDCSNKNRVDIPYNVSERARSRRALSVAGISISYSVDRGLFMGIVPSQLDLSLRVSQRHSPFQNEYGCNLRK